MGGGGRITTGTRSFVYMNVEPKKLQNFKIFKNITQPETEKETYNFINFEKPEKPLLNIVTE